MGEKNRKVDSEFIEFVKHEINYDKDTVYSNSLKKAKNVIVKLCKVIDKEPMPDLEKQAVVKIFAKLAMGMPLTPLTGEDNEWKEVDIASEPNVKWQNKRCPRVYKREDGTAFDSEYYTFTFGNGIYFKNEASSKDIEFPYTVKPSIRARYGGEKDGNKGSGDSRETEGHGKDNRGHSGNEQILS